MAIFISFYTANIHQSQRKKQALFKTVYNKSKYCGLTIFDILTFKSLNPKKYHNIQLYALRAEIPLCLRLAKITNANQELKFINFLELHHF
jgi:hypothetical protein